ncbi:MAG: hypothetical protein JWO85_1235 [Candidatus Eremiobacteraeota bacterium]|nr:hypothetical protein [Candidatus Eremiobacteraeota bacterium]
MGTRPAAFAAERRAVNVSLTNIAENLATVIVMPLNGWLTARFGRRELYVARINATATPASSSRNGVAA